MRKSRELESIDTASACNQLVNTKNIMELLIIDYRANNDYL